MIDIPLDTVVDVADRSIVTGFYLADALQHLLPAYVSFHTDNGLQDGVQSLAQVIEHNNDLSGGHTVCIPCDSDVPQSVIEQLVASHVDHDNRITRLCTSEVIDHNPVSVDAGGRIVAHDNPKASNIRGDLGVVVYDNDWFRSIPWGHDMDSWDVLEVAIQNGEAAATCTPRDTPEQIDIGTPRSYYNYLIRNNERTENGNVYFPKALRNNQARNCVFLPSSSCDLIIDGAIVGENMNTTSSTQLLQIQPS